MRKVILILFALSSILRLAGCDNNTNNDYYEEVEGKSFPLKSDSKKIVFESERLRYVFYYHDDEIIEFKAYIEYKSDEDAINADKSLNESELENVDDHYTDGPYLVLIYNRNEYEDLKVEDVKEKYSYMEEL